MTGMLRLHHNEPKREDVYQELEEYSQNVMRISVQKKRARDGLRPGVWCMSVCAVTSAHVLESDWCWEDPREKKHYKHRAPHLERLVDHVYGGGSLKSHKDVPDDICHDVVLESQVLQPGSPCNLRRSSVCYETFCSGVLGFDT